MTQQQHPSTPLRVPDVLTLEYLACLTEEEQKQVIGEKIYPKVKEWHDGRAPKLTGMLLGLNNLSLLSMSVPHLFRENFSHDLIFQSNWTCRIRNEKLLKEKTDEALELLLDHERKKREEAEKEDANKKKNTDEESQQMSSTVMTPSTTPAHPGLLTGPDDGPIRPEYGGNWCPF